jgi:tRNA (adenine57-N1/adenine58-N1)-methyltransferase catalytic subunit
VRPLEPGERVLLTDSKGRRYLITLEPGRVFHTHRGRLAHDELIGGGEGRTVRTDLGQRLLVLRPTLADWILKMPRGAQVIYPRVLALMVMQADIRPGLTVAEAGAGSGALSIALLQALGPDGRLLSWELREDFAERARANVEAWFGKPPATWELRLGDVVEGLAAAGEVDRVLLDLLDPWNVVAAAAGALVPGGSLVAFVATIPQVMRTVEALNGSGAFGEAETSEAIVRPWHVDGLAVRPEHRMIGHTGFLVAARRLEAASLALPAPGHTARGGDRVGTDDKIENKSQEIRGKVKEKVGEATDDEALEAQGRTDQTAADVKQAGEKIKDAFKR